MKKVLYPVAIATLIFVSCGKENVAPINKDAPIIEEIVEPAAPALSLNATFEDLQKGTKADINGSNQLVWAGGDKIGVYVNNGEWAQKNHPFTLDGAGGTTSGRFIWDYDEGNFTSHDATVAYFPWNGTNGATNNNVYEGTMYFKLPGSYYGYTSGKMLTPLVAPMHYNGSTYDNVQFKHAGAAVKVTINNLPAGAHSIGMTVDGQQIWGNYQVNPANAGTDALSLDGAAQAGNTTIWLNYTNSSESAFTFLFPVPELTSPRLSFQLYDENDILVWSFGPTSAQPSVGRAQVLAMPALTFKASDLYTAFNANSTEWFVRGSFSEGNSWGTDVKMITNGSICIAHGLTFEAASAFKLVKKVGDDYVWCGGTFGSLGVDFDLQHNSGNDISIGAAGTYDIIFNPSNYKVRIVNSSSFQYPSAK